MTHKDYHEFIKRENEYRKLRALQCDNHEFSEEDINELMRQAEDIIYPTFSDDVIEEMLEQEEYANKFDTCCSSPNLVKYENSHNGSECKNYTEKNYKVISYILLSCPNTASAQSENQAIFSDFDLDEFVFEHFMKYNGLLHSDYLLLEQIDKYYIDYYRKKICTNCSKVILTREVNKKSNTPKETWSEAFFRHVRNIIAHGEFKFVDSMLIGFDYNKQHSKCTAIIKINPIRLIRMIEYAKNQVILQECLPPSLPPSFNQKKQ